MAKVEANNKPETADDKYFSKALGKALDLLGILRETAKPISLGELTRQGGLPKSSVFRILHTLEQTGYVERDEAGSYELSSDARALVPAFHVSDIVRACGSLAKELQRKFPETISVGVLFDNHIEVVSVLESPQRIRMGNTVGRIIPPHASSLGKVLAAHQNEEYRERIWRSYGLHAFTPRTITDETELRQELDTVKTRGYATDEEENTADGSCVGAPIWRDDQVAAAISVSMPKTRFPQGAERDKLVDALIETARKISRELSSAP